MVFSSLLFMFKFLPIAFLIYYFVPFKYKNLTILILSLLFYSWGEPKYILIMFASIFVDFFISKGIECNRDKKNVTKLLLLTSVCFNLGMLMFFKYTNFFIENLNHLTGTTLAYLKLTLPLGISFYTFQTMSYTIDVYLGKVRAEKNLINFGAFVCLFPQLIAGPIVKYSDISEELQHRKISLPQIDDGVRLFIMGLASKVLIANSIGALWDSVLEIGFINISTPLAYMGLLAFALQIYFDFSGYSLMAIGLGKMLGFNFPQNFNYPYISKSVTEFWRRWHMTLGSWFREYVYIPLGGNRCTPLRTYFNLFVVWFLTGFWHGASWNFILWGLYFLVLLVIEKKFLLKYLQQSKVLSHVYLILAIFFSWGLFALTDFTSMAQMFNKLFIFKGGNDYLFYLRNYGVTFLIAFFFSTPVLKNWYEKNKERKGLITMGLAILLLISVAYLVDASYNPFLYFRF
ncbi:MAG TPA: transcriptional regulator [Firmicutes bacterium]|nr:transcriptional regulator [Bacillota bacterium]